ncbi:MAG: LysE family translocator [Roseovarius sp.]|nr:LysE family translocator [Roseovarius sp.]MCY4207248.1 LysE family translocator [Roseovarius sp.]MCY4291366.1 LysE family translocator [Roseovarius sp.]
MPFEILTAFTLAVFLLALAPGPDNVFVLTQSSVSGPGAGIWVVLGLCTGLVFHTAAVAFGIAALIKASALAFTTLKLAGAAYLLYLAWQAFCAGARKFAHLQAPLSALQLYRRGLIMNLTNPKVAIFFLAFFPQFTDPERGLVFVQMAILGFAFIIVTFTVFGGIAVLSGAGLRTLAANSPRAQIIINRMAGLIFAALALTVLASER